MVDQEVNVDVSSKTTTNTEKLDKEKSTLLPSPVLTEKTPNISPIKTFILDSFHLATDEIFSKLMNISLLMQISGDVNLR